MKRKPHQRRIGSGFQAVQQRLLMAGDVSVSFSNSDLTITGDNASNRIQVSTVNGLLRVSGIGTTINNGTAAFAVNANLVDDIRIDMNGGNDFVQVNNVDLDNTSHGLLDIETDSGDDLIGVYNSYAQDLNIRSGSDNDHAIVSFTQTGNDMDLELGSGHDELDLYSVLADDIRIKGGSGNDDVAIQFAQTIDDLDVDLEGGHDDLWIYQGIYGNDVRIEAGDDNDQVTLNSVTINDDLDIRMEDGADKLYLYSNFVADNVYLHGGSGSDYLSAGGNNFNAFNHDWSF